MARPLLAMPFWGDSSGIQASSSLQTAPVANLLKKQPKELWDANADSSVWIELDRGSEHPISLVSLLFTNLTSSATWRVRVGTTQAEVQGGSAAIDSGTVTAWASIDIDSWARRHTLYRFTQGNYRWLRIDLDDATNPDNTIRAGRLFCSAEWRSTLHMHAGASLGHEENTRVRFGADGSTRFKRTTERVQVHRYTIGYLTEDEALDNYYEIQRRRGASEDVLSVMDPDSTDHLHKYICYGPLELGELVKPVFGHWEIQVEVRERV